MTNDQITITKEILGHKTIAGYLCFGNWLFKRSDLRHNKEEKWK